MPAVYGASARGTADATRMTIDMHDAGPGWRESAAAAQGHSTGIGFSWN
jgi:hypothetical protein